jgi:hypothetical protein
MGLKLINDTLKLKNFEKELSELFFNKFNETKLISYKNIENENIFFSLKYSLDSNLWFDYQKNLSSITYLIGDLNCPTKYPNLNMRCNFIKPHISININFTEPNSGNCRFAIESKNNEKYLLLETDTSNAIIDSLKLLGLKNISVKGNDKKYFKIEFTNIIEYLEAFVKNIEFYPINSPLNIKSYDKKNLHRDLLIIHKHIKIIPNNNSYENNVKTDDASFSDKLNKPDIPDNFKCEVCKHTLPKNSFRKSLISGEYSKICKNCEDKILAAKYLKLILKYVEPGEKFNKEKLIRQHPKDDFNEIIFTLQEQDLIRKNYGSFYSLKNQETINDFINKYSNISIKNNKKQKESITENINNESQLKEYNNQNNINLTKNNGNLTTNKVSNTHTIVNEENNSNLNSNQIKCLICQNTLHKNKFNKSPLSGEYSKICKKCEEKIFTIKFLKLFMNYVQPGEKFNKTELIIKHTDKDLSEVIFTLQEENLIKKDYESNYYLESEEVLNNFLDNFLKRSPQLNEKYNSLNKETN